MDGFNRITDDQRERLQGAQSPEELLEKAREEGLELTDEQLESISGGGFWGGSDSNPGVGVKCPQCGSSDVRIEYSEEGWDQCVFRCYGCRAGWIGPLPPDLQ